MRKLRRDRGADVGRVVADVRDVLAGQASLLAGADVHHRRAEERALLDPRRRVADETGRMREQRHEIVGRHVGDEAHVRRELGMLLAHVPQAVGHFAGAGVGIRPEPDRRQLERRHHPQRRLEVRAVVVVRRHRMLNDHQVRLLDVDVVSDAKRVDVLAGDRGADVRGQLDVERTGIEDERRILAHRQDPAVRVLIGHKMDVRELGDRVTDAFVDAAGDVAALDVRDRDVQVGRGHRDGQLLESVAANHDQIRRRRVEAVRELERGEARGLGHRHVVAAFDHVEQRCLDVEAAGGDVVGNVAAVLVEQDRSAKHQLEVDVGMGVELLDQQLAAPVVGAAGDRKTDFALG